jgi:hypothetical protein
MLGHSMAVPQRAKAQSPEEIIVLLTTAVILKKPISAVYGNHPRWLCPHVLGWSKDGELQALCYQYAGSSSSGLAPGRSPSNWRCLALFKLSAVQLLDGHWRSAEQHSRPQACIEQVLIDTEKLPV